jgi:hypothetical protein
LNSAYDALFSFLRRRCRFDEYDAEFVYHFLVLTPELHRALSNGVRAHLGVNGFNDELTSLRQTEYVVNWSFRSLVQQARPVAGHLGWMLATHVDALEWWQKTWTEEHGAIRRSDALGDAARSRIRQSLGARWMCRAGAI